MGDFTYNTFSKVGIEGQEIRLHCVVDLAEIPTFRESKKIDRDRDGQLSDYEPNNYLDDSTEQYIENLNLSVNDESLDIEVVERIKTQIIV